MAIPPTTARTPTNNTPKRIFLVLSSWAGTVVSAGMTGIGEAAGSGVAAGVSRLSLGGVAGAGAGVSGAGVGVGLVDAGTGSFGFIGVLN